MTSSKPTHLKLYYTIGEVAEMFGVNVSMIRYYEKEFDDIKPHKNKKGNRLFTQPDVEVFSRIFELIRDKGYTLAEVKVLIAQKKTSSETTIPEPVSGQAELVARLKSVRKKLEQLLNKLDQ